MNNVKDSIGWAQKSFNPVTGCRRTPPCKYCYAKRIHDRFDAHVPFSHMEFHEERLLDTPPKKPCKIFVGSMSEIEYWHEEWTKQIINYCRRFPKHTFMFLSKNPMSYCGYLWPANTMQGLTLTCAQTQHYQGENIETITKYPRPFLSIEPLHGYLQILIPKEIELVIVGAETGRGAKPPRPEWIENIKVFVPADKIYWKKNIRQYL